MNNCESVCYWFRGYKQILVNRHIFIMESMNNEDWLYLYCMNALCCEDKSWVAIPISLWKQLIVFFILKKCYLVDATYWCKSFSSKVVISGIPDGSLPSCFQGHLHNCWVGWVGSIWVEVIKSVFGWCFWLQSLSTAWLWARQTVSPLWKGRSGVHQLLVLSHFNISAIAWSFFKKISNWWCVLVLLSTFCFLSGWYIK